MKINEKYNKFKFGKFFNELNMMTMEKVNRRPFLPSYQMPQNDFKSYSKNLPFSLKPKIRPVSQEYPKVSFGKITKAGRFLKPIHYNDIASSSSSISSVSPFSPSYNTVSSLASAGQQVRNFTASRRPLQGPLSLSQHSHTDIDSYGKPLANVIQRRPNVVTHAESQGDSYGRPLGDIITNSEAGGHLPLSTNTVTLNNLNKYQQDSYGQPLSPVMGVTETSAQSQDQPLSIFIGGTEARPSQTNKKLIAVYPQLKKQNKMGGRIFVLLSIKYSFCHSYSFSSLLSFLGKDEFRAPEVMEGLENSVPVILDNVENFNQKVKEDKMQEDYEDYDLLPYFYNDVDDDTKIGNEEVDDKLLIVEPVELLGLPEVERTKDGNKKEQKMFKISETEVENIPEINFDIEGIEKQEGEEEEEDQKEQEKEKEDDVKTTEDQKEQEKENEGARDDVKTTGWVQTRETEAEEGGPLQTTKSRNRAEKGLRLPGIRIQNARIHILGQSDAVESSEDDIVFLIYLNETALTDDQTETDSGEQIEDLIFQD